MAGDLGREKETSVIAIGLILKAPALYKHCAEHLHI